MNIFNFSNLKKDRYYRWDTFFLVFNVFSEPLFFFLIMVFNLHIILAEYMKSAGFGEFIYFLLMFLGFSVMHLVVYFPLSFIRSYVIQKKFGMSNQSFRSWFKDYALASLLKGFFVFIILMIIYYMQRNTMESWWFYSFVITSAIYLVLSYIAPILIFPLFFKFTPLTNEVLKERLLNFVKAQNLGLEIKGLYEVDLSRKTNAANAAFMGFGKTRRVAFSDTLLCRFSEDEIEAILAHELGHYKNKHLKTGTLMTNLFLLLFFFSAAVILNLTNEFFGIKNIADPVSMPLLGLVFSIEGIVMLPVFNSIIRRFEYQADAYAAKTATKPEALISALDKLADVNLVKKEPGEIVEFLFHSHPSIKKRIDYLKTFLHITERIESEISESKTNESEKTEDKTETDNSETVE